jgi:hypothetical protein
MGLSAHDQPYDERTGKNSGNERDNYRRHGTFPFPAARRLTQRGSPTTLTMRTDISGWHAAKTSPIR